MFALPETPRAWLEVLSDCYFPDRVITNKVSNKKLGSRDKLDSPNAVLNSEFDTDSLIQN